MNIQYPVYSVVTPQTGEHFTLRTLTVADEKKLKGSFVTPDKISEHIASCIFDCLVEKPAHIRTFKDFIACVTTHDRQALLFGLFHISYGEVTDIPVKCGSCGETFKFTHDTGALAHITEYEPRMIKMKQKDAEGKDVEVEVPESILTRVLEVDLPISKYRAIVKQPTIRDEIINTAATGQLPYQKDALSDMIVIDRFEMNKKKFDEVGQKLSIYTALPSKDRRIIMKTYREEFAKYTVDVKGKAECSYCKHETEIDIDFMDVFFRMVLES